MGHLLLDAVSFRSQLTGKLLEFLKREGIECVPTTEAAVELVASLADYREEGARLFPKVFICNDLQTLKGRLGADSMIVPIGAGSPGRGTMKAALKECAALAQGVWSLYIERQQNEYHYGLFSSSGGPIAVSTVDLLLEVFDAKFPILCISQLSPNIVEIRGGSGRRLQCFLSASDSGDSAPSKAVEELVQLICRDVPQSIREPTTISIHRVITGALQACHGTLIAVVGHRRSALPRVMRDAIVLAPSFRYCDYVGAHARNRAVTSLLSLEAIDSLVRGMICSDGITVFRTDAAIIAYRVMIGSRGGQRGAVVGGSRRRAYQAMCELLQRDLLGSFFRSQDGATDFRSRHVK